MQVVIFVVRDGVQSGVGAGQGGWQCSNAHYKSSLFFFKINTNFLFQNNYENCENPKMNPVLTSRAPQDWTRREHCKCRKYFDARRICWNTNQWPPEKIKSLKCVLQFGTHQSCFHWIIAYLQELKKMHDYLYSHFVLFSDVGSPKFHSESETKICNPKSSWNQSVVKTEHINPTLSSKCLLT